LVGLVRIQKEQLKTEIAIRVTSVLWRRYVDTTRIT
jgi:hypothetical protein